MLVPTAPPLSPPVAPAIDEDLLRAHTGQTAVRDVAGGLALVERLSGEAGQLGRAYDKARVTAWYRRLRLVSARWGYAPILDAVAVASALALAGCLLAIFVLSASAPSLVGIIVAAYGLVGAPLAVLTYDRLGEDRAGRRALRAGEDAAAAAEARVARERWAAAEDAVARAQALVAQLRVAAEEARLRRVQADRTGRLLQVKCDQLSGGQFEAFLADVFRNLGYEVAETGQSGDQGVDLVVRTAGAAVAVQAKCYAGPVGNDAVQQVYAGKAYRGCERAVVVTNSTFTRSARALAAVTGVLLVDGEQLPDLVRGRVRP